MKEVVPPYPSDVKEAPLTQLEKPLQIAVNTPVTISGLTSKTRYEAVVKVDKKSLVKLEADGKVGPVRRLSPTSVLSANL